MTSLIQLTQVEGQNDLYEQNDNTNQQYKCKAIPSYNDENKDSNGFFFGQGKSGDHWGIATCTGIFVGAGILWMLVKAVETKNTNPVTDIIHIFGLNAVNILVLLFIFGLAPFGFAYWLGKCKNSHPGDHEKKLDSWLPKIPFIASILLVFYPAALLFSGNITNWIHQTVFYGLMIFFGGLGATEYWPSYIRNSMGGSCNYMGKFPGDGFSHSGIHYVIFIVFCIISSFILLLAGYWISIAFAGKIHWTHGLNPIGAFRNILITSGLLMTNLIGGLKVFEASDVKLNE